MPHNNPPTLIQNFELTKINYEKNIQQKTTLKNNVIKHVFKNGYKVEVHLKTNTAYKILGEKNRQILNRKLNSIQFL